jgi:hypothetical protein
MASSEIHHLQCGSSDNKKLCQQVINETKDNSNVKDKDLYRETRVITLSTNQGFTE